MRFTHLASACLLTGVFAFLVFVALPAIRTSEPSNRDRFRAMDRRLLALAAVTLAVVLGTGLCDLVRQAFVATRGGVAGGLALQTVASLLAETRYGDVWLVRHALLVLLAALLALRPREDDLWDWVGLRCAGLVLATTSLAAAAASGHAASAPGPATRAIAADTLHLVAAGVWAGALVPLVLFLRWIRTRGSDVAWVKVGAVAVRRFSTLGLISVTVMIASGGYTAITQVERVPALLGTAYGHWLLVKLALFVAVVAVAFMNRARVRRLLETTAAPGGDEREAPVLFSRLGSFVVVEALLVAGILGAVAVLGLTTPARHDPVDWPLPFRLSWETTNDLPGVRARVIVGAALGMFGLLASLVTAGVSHRWWRPALVAGAVTVLLGLAIALPPLSLDAYPTTYVRPAVPYTAASIVRGHALYREHCAGCHGASGAGDGITPRPRTLGSEKRSSVERSSVSRTLTGRRIADHTAGDIFWWLTSGVRGSSMPAFGDR
ncbi:MAG: hypothetical protein DMD81_14655, partial [Candidatus Rokuibacteriota bacterium]